jgi:hypothetical protein
MRRPHRVLIALPIVAAVITLVGLVVDGAPLQRSHNQSTVVPIATWCGFPLDNYAQFSDVKDGLQIGIQGPKTASLARFKSLEVPFRVFILNRGGDTVAFSQHPFDFSLEIYGPSGEHLTGGSVFNEDVMSPGLWAVRVLSTDEIYSTTLYPLGLARSLAERGEYRVQAVLSGMSDNTLTSITKRACSSGSPESPRPSVA